MKSVVDTNTIPEPFYRYFKPQEERPQPPPKLQAPLKPNHSDLVFLMAALLLCED